MINIDKKLFLQHPRNIFAISSGVGSMGKTWFSVTLAHALNTISKSVLLLDADNSILNVSFQLALEGKPNLNQVMDGVLTLNQACISLNRKKFDVLTGVSGSVLFENVSDGRMQIFRDDLLLLAQKYDYVLQDVPPSERIMQHLLPRETTLLLVCTNDPSNLVSTYNFMKDVADNKQYKNLQIVVNYANSYEEGLQTYGTLRRACEQYIRTTPKLLGVIRRDTRVRDAIRNHVLLLNRYPDSEAAEDVLQIARRLIQTEEDYEQ